MRTKEQIQAEYESLFRPDGGMSKKNQARAYALLKEYQEVHKLSDSTTSPRAGILEEATTLITGDRNNVYGPPTQDFDRTAGMMNSFGFSVNGKPLEGHHVAIFMVLLKMSRLAWTPNKRDSWVDAAGYAACGYECAITEEGRKVKDDGIWMETESRPKRRRFLRWKRA